MGSKFDLLKGGVKTAIRAGRELTQVGREIKQAASLLKSDLHALRERNTTGLPTNTRRSTLSTLAPQAAMTLRHLAKLPLIAQRHISSGAVPLHVNTQGADATVFLGNDPVAQDQGPARPTPGSTTLQASHTNPLRTSSRPASTHRPVPPPPLVTPTQSQPAKPLVRPSRLTSGTVGTSTLGKFPSAQTVLQATRPRPPTSQPTGVPTTPRPKPSAFAPFDGNGRPLDAGLSAAEAEFASTPSRPAVQPRPVARPVVSTQAGAAKKPPPTRVPTEDTQPHPKTTTASETTPAKRTDGGPPAPGKPVAVQAAKKRVVRFADELPGGKLATELKPRPSSVATQTPTRPLKPALKPPQRPQVPSSPPVATRTTPSPAMRSGSRFVDDVLARNNIHLNGGVVTGNITVNGQVISNGSGPSSHRRTMTPAEESAFNAAMGAFGESMSALGDTMAASTAANRTQVTGSQSTLVTGPISGSVINGEFISNVGGQVRTMGPEQAATHRAMNDRGDEMKALGAQMSALAARAGQPGVDEAMEALGERMEALGAEMEALGGSMAASVSTSTSAPSGPGRTSAAGNAAPGQAGGLDPHLTANADGSYTFSTVPGETVSGLDISVDGPLRLDLAPGTVMNGNNISSKGGLTF